MDMKEALKVIKEGCKEFKAVCTNCPIREDCYEWLFGEPAYWELEDE